MANTGSMNDIQNLFKETIERAFADAKETHVIRYTQYSGLP